MTKTAKITAFVAAAAFIPFLIGQGQVAAQPAMMAQADQTFSREPWPSQRVIILLPLQLGPGWNLNLDMTGTTLTPAEQQAALRMQKAKTDAILKIAEQKLQQALQRTGKFSTTQVHRYNPIFLRRIADRPLTVEERGGATGEERLLTKEQFDALVANPTLEGVQSALSALNFEQEPLIAQFFMEEVTTQLGSPSPVVSAEVTGNLYEVDNPVAVRTVVSKLDPVPLYLPRKQGKQTIMVRRSASDRIIAAADKSFMQIAREFVKPIDDILLPEPTMPELPADGILPGSPFVPGQIPGATGPTRVPPKVIPVPSGQVLGSFKIPAPTAPRPAAPQR